MAEEDDSKVQVNVRRGEIDPLDRPAVFCIGHPRSGTSLSSNILASDETVEWLTNTGSQQNEEVGYFEYKPFLSQSVAFMNEQWDITQADEVAGVLETMRQLDHNPGAKILHPHSWYNWKQFFEDTKNLLIFREPTHTRKSLWNHRLNWPIDWYTSANVQIGIYEDAENAVLVKFKRLMQEPEKVGEKIYDELGLEVDTSIVDSDEWHERETRTVVGQLEEMVYDRLTELEEEQYE